MSLFIATLFGVGYLRPAPGTWGSLAALPLGLGVYMLGGWIALAVGIVIATIVGTWAIANATRGSEDHDPSEIVIDELAGQWIAILPLAYGADYAGAAILDLWPGWITAFAAFRLFDITKPWLVGRADRKGTPWGVMEDDLWAGFFAAIVVIVLAIIAHVVLI